MGILTKEIYELEKKGYICEKETGKGNCSTVVKVEKYGNELVCKISDRLPELMREAHMLKMIKHPAFPQYYDFWEHDKKGYLVMEFAGMYNLEAMMKRKSFSQKEAIETAIQIAEGIRFLHDMNRPLLYRDLKAENIVPGSEKVKIVDMGSAAFIDEAGKDIVGTWGYAPPEQMRGTDAEKNYSQGKYSDVYSFGRLLHYMLTGDSPYLPPFKKPGIKNYDNSFDRELERLVNCCVRNNPYERIPDMGFVLQELETIHYRMTHEKHLFNITVIKNKKMGDYLYEKNIIFR